MGVIVNAAKAVSLPFPGPRPYLGKTCLALAGVGVSVTAANGAVVVRVPVGSDFSVELHDLVMVS